MAVRTTMAALILRTRLLINDTLPAGSGQIFADQDIQDVLDESRRDIFNLALKPQPTFSGTTISYLDYMTDLGGWEDGYTLKQYLTVVVTPTTLEPIAGHWGFAATTLPPVYITGRLFDVYRSAADLLERWAAKWALLYSVTVSGQSLQRDKAHAMLLDLAKQYRMKQRAGQITVARADIAGGIASRVSLGPTEADFMASG